jgi:KH domain
MPSSSNSSYRPSNRRSGGYVGSSYVPGGSSYSNPYLQGVSNPAQQLQTQQIYIPNDLVGCIIGKGGSKINEIMHMSASQIKIMEPGAGPVGSAPGGSEGERLVVITGPPANIQMAVQLLYHVSCVLTFLFSCHLIHLCSAWSRRNRSRFGLLAVIPHKLICHLKLILCKMQHSF